MALVSMTGFAEALGGSETLRWRWETKSVNGRGLDLRLRMPPGLDGLEPRARQLAGERFRRGSIQASLSLELHEAARGIRVDPAALNAVVKLAKQIQKDSGLAAAHVDGLLALKGVIVQDEALALDSEARAARDASLLETLASAFDSLASARKNEGNKLSDILRTQIAEISRLTDEASRLAATQPLNIRNKLDAQLKDLVASGSFQEDRIAQEVALLAVRADVREELDRLQAHVQAATALIESDEAIGRRLDFLAQEFNREANTLCSKSTDIQLTRTGLGLKATIDQFREQAQNVE